jgi:predicted RNA-binding protein YlxR (DUF448 family)
LIRIVRTPDQSVVFDDTGRMSGRGAYLCADGSCWTTALKKSSIARALGVPLPAELRATLEEGPQAALEDRLSVEVRAMPRAAAPKAAAKQSIGGS